VRLAGKREGAWSGSRSSGGGNSDSEDVEDEDEVDVGMGVGGCGRKYTLEWLKDRIMGSHHEEGEGPTNGIESQQQSGPLDRSNNNSNEGMAKENTTATKSVKLPICVGCEQGIVKPDITFFGEGLPERFHLLCREDLRNADALIVMGTSLQVSCKTCFLSFSGCLHT
jgi:hypothetical protein